MSVITSNSGTFRQFYICIKVRPVKIIRYKMNLFNKLFGNKSDSERSISSDARWTSLESIEQLTTIEKESFSKPQVIFKHSTTCGISSMVLNRFTHNFSIDENQMDLYLLDLQRYRQISNIVVERFQVAHQSPQLLVLKHGKVVAHDSHGGITDINLEEFL